MKMLPRTLFRPPCRRLPRQQAQSAQLPVFVLARRTLRNATISRANVAPIVGTGPPPDPPAAVSERNYERARRRRKQLELLEQAKGLRTRPGLKKRFWKDVTVQEIDGAYQIHLDKRPLRHPSTREIVRLPLSKPNLALGLALEWDQMTSAAHASKQHLIPLTSLVCRALDLTAEGRDGPIRASLATLLPRYLDTDSLLCWAPEGADRDGGESLREAQRRTSEEVVSFLTSRVWTGIRIVPVLDGASILPKRQDEVTRGVVKAWITSLDAWELAGLEKAVMAGKSLLAGARLLVEWSEGPVGVNRGETDRSFGVEEAARAVSLEVDWQTRRWGEVEDTHDVEKEDLRRHLGSAVLLVSGTGRQ